jgi:hypothetical protein
MRSPGGSGENCTKKCYDPASCASCLRVSQIVLLFASSFLKMVRMGTASASPQSTHGPEAARAGTEGLAGTEATGSEATSVRDTGELPSKVASHRSSSSTFWRAACYSARISSSSRPRGKVCCCTARVMTCWRWWALG